MSPKTYRTTMLFVCALFASFVSAALAQSRLDEKPSSAARTLSDVSGGREKRGAKNCLKAPLRNLALHKTVAQSTTYPGNDAHRASNAVDGIRQAHWDSPYCAHTNAENNPYWYVDLGGEHAIERVEIVNRVGFEDRFRDVSVVVAKEDGKYDQTCGHYKGPAKGVPVVNIRCPAYTCGRYVKIQMATSPPEYLMLCEVEVYGY